MSSRAQINEMTLSEHQRYLQADGHRTLDEAEARRIHATDEVSEYFGSVVTAVEPAQSLGFTRSVVTVETARAEAKMQGFTGDACSACGNFTVVMNGTCKVCRNCGTTTGCS